METQIVYKDLFLTERYFIKGSVHPLNGRLSSFLDRHTRRFIPIRNAMLLDLEDASEIPTPLVRLNTAEILFSHELIAFGGDVHQKLLSADDSLAFVRVVLRGPQGVSLGGRIRPDAWGRNTFNQRFFILQGPRMDGLPEALQCEIDLLGSLGYLIVNKDQVGYIFDY